MCWPADRRGKLLRQSGVRDLSDADCARKKKQQFGSERFFRYNAIASGTKHATWQVPDQRQHSMWTHVLPAEFRTPRALGEPATIVIVRRPFGALFNASDCNVPASKYL